MHTTANCGARFRVAHLSSAHPRTDIRIFTKQCRSLVAQGYEVHLVVADGLGDAVREGVTISDAGRSGGRWRRMSGAVRRVLARARALDADLYHLHDPELLPAALALKRDGARVIFDAHEDVPLQLLNKPYLRPALRRLLAAVYARFEAHAARRLDGVVGATPPIAERFATLNARTVCVRNYPLLAEFSDLPPRVPGSRNVCYLGDLSRIRGAVEMVQAMARLRTPARLNLAGPSAEPGLLAQLQRAPGWERVNALGQLDRNGVRQVLARSCAGLVVLHPTPSYRSALPIKMFEYMAAGLPVIASDFPAWRAIIDAHQCGVCVDPLDVEALAAAIDALDADPMRARRMGANGRRAVLAQYYWEREVIALFDLYARILGPAAPASGPATPTNPTHSESEPC